MNNERTISEAPKETGGAGGFGPAANLAAEQALAHLVESADGALGQDFLKFTPGFLARQLGVAGVGVGRFLPGGDRVECLFMHFLGQEHENVIFPVTGTPCEALQREGHLLISEGVQEQFPGEPMLKQMGVVGYEGVTVRGHSGAVAGMLCLLHTGPLPPSPARQHLLQVISSRLGAELERLNAEATLRQSELRYRTLVENVPGVIYRCANDADWTMYFISDSIQDLVGYPPADFLGSQARSYESIILPEDRDLVWQGVQRGVENQTTFELAYRVMHRDGSVRWVKERGRGVHDNTGTLMWLDGVIMDVTATHHAEEALTHAQKLESLGVLAGGIAHDFNNILVSVLGNTDLALARLRADPNMAEAFLKKAAEAGTRASDLCRQLLDYAGQTPFQTRPVDLNGVLLEMSELLHTALQQKCPVAFDLQGGLPPVEADPTQLRQVALNLMLNAAEAMSGRDGQIKVTTRLFTPTVDFLQNAVTGQGIPPGPHVMLEVSDEGVGMDPHTQQRIFDRFFSTKTQGRGLGLAATLGIVRRHGGAMHLTSVKGVGSTFRVLWPQSSKTLEPPGATPPTPALKGRGAILVVDDEPAVCDVARETLGNLGFEVLTAHNGQVGEEVFQSHKDKVVGVLLDMNMPVKNGEETFRSLRQISPTLPIVLTSGFHQHQAMTQSTGEHAVTFLPKPFTPSRLQEAFCHLLPR